MSHKPTTSFCGLAFSAFWIAPDPLPPQPIKPIRTVSRVPAPWANRPTFSVLPAATAAVAAVVVFKKDRREFWDGFELSDT